MEFEISSEWNFRGLGRGALGAIIAALGTGFDAACMRGINVLPLAGPLIGEWRGQEGRARRKSRQAAAAGALVSRHLSRNEIGSSTWPRQRWNERIHPWRVVAINKRAEPERASVRRA